VAEDISLLRIMSITNGYLAAVVFVIYIHGKEFMEFYSRPQIFRWLVFY